MADEFMFGNMDQDTRECLRGSGADRLRHNFVNAHFGVASVNPEFVRTFYPVERKKLAKHGGSAGFFTHECSRISL